MIPQPLARLVLLGALLGLAVFAWWPALVSAPGDGLLTVRFLDVGQGDAIHIVTPDGVEVLVDGGPSAAVLREFARGRSWLDRHIDLVVATHPDTDHVGGLVDVLDRYHVSWLLDTPNRNDAPAADAYLAAAMAEGATRVTAQRGQSFALGASTTLLVFSPWGDPTDWGSNAASVVLLLTYGDTGFLLTGDAGKGTEEALVRTFGRGLEAEVLKLGHHGSDTSTSDLLLDTVTPEYAVVSAGAGNRYGHPHEAVVARVLERDITLVSTAERGTITFKSDGDHVWVE